MKNTIRVSTCSLNQTPMDWYGNIENIKEAIQQANKDGAAILITPELSITGYGCEDFFYTPHLSEEALKHTLELTQHVPETMVVAVGLPVLINNRVYNGVAMLTHNGIKGISLKRNLAANGLHYEQRWFTPWTSKKNALINLPGIEEEVAIGNIVYDVNGVKVGLEICEDGWVSARTAQGLFDQGVDIIANPSASHFSIGKFLTRKRLVEESSRAYSACYVYSNLSGCESGRSIYDAGAMIAVDGKLVKQGKRFHYSSCEVVTADIDLSQSRIGQINTSQRYYSDFNAENQTIKVKLEHNFDSKILDKSFDIEAWELSDNLAHEEAIRAISIGLRDWSRKTKTQGYALSLSGGADSALVGSATFLSVYFELAELISKKDNGGFSPPEYLLQYMDDELVSKLESLDSSNDSLHTLKVDICPSIVSKYLTCAYQGSSNSGDVTLNAAKSLAREIGSKFHNFNISNLVDSYEGMIGTSLGIEFDWDKHDIARQNIQARVRSPSIWMVANLENKLLLTTSNMSEGAVGYVTMDGDSSGVLAPISGVTKTRILSMLQWLEEKGVTVNEDYSVCLHSLSFINNQRPTAELRPTAQQDEDDLMPFPILDRILILTLEAGKSPTETWEAICVEFPNFSKATLCQYVVRYFQLLFRNQWKRDRQAPGFHIEINSLDPKTYKRFPLLSSAYEKEILELQAEVDTFH
ncbi:NAD(+) synthase [Vibrio parahaemolyticus]|uniref:NAD(+) synthase n=1 Tax=Vibrio parahaemolyticus TaxID=670 RepID=UPI0006C2FD91|nr:NAD(+) synthase [Vibrio parahaemolyticus]KOY38046.1 NAD+ synthetase [Vibrio parahaemolyticus]MCS0114860.1 NAD(+) synthase [Vibrio parahaemolyticus]